MLRLSVVIVIGDQYPNSTDMFISCWRPYVHVSRFWCVSGRNCAAKHGTPPSKPALRSTGTKRITAATAPMSKASS